MSGEPLKEAIAALWLRAFGRADGLEMTPCAASGNNRVFVLRCDGRSAVAKCYFSGPSETRDRLDAEWRFLTYAAEAGIANVPRPLARDDAARLALHQLCEGRKPELGEIGEPAVVAAAHLFRDLNRQRRSAAAAQLPPAAEACFSAAAQIALVDRRMARLAALPEESELDAAAAALAGRMAEFWADLRSGLPDRLRALGVDPVAECSAETRCISPSDFGFHNALFGPDGQIRFIDFEYGGWDDPVKMLCDFFLQPQRPVDPSHRDLFFAETLGDWPDGERIAAHAALMQPLFALKWCCIMLNPFVPDLAGRGRFADPTQDQSDHKQRRLDSATAAFRTLRGR